MSTFRSPNGVRAKPFTYEGFQGLDSSRALTAMESGKRQYLATLKDGYCDWRGQIVRTSGAVFRKGEFPVTHVRFFGRDLACWAERTGAGIRFNSDRDHQFDPSYPRNAVVSSTVFNKQAVLGARGLPTYRYNGTVWVQNKSPTMDFLRPAYFAAVQRRLAVAGIAGRETQVHLSRVDNDDIFTGDEARDSNNVLRAGFIDVSNLLGTADQITGLTAWEQSRMVVFTADRAIVFRIDPDITQWTVDERANISVGCASQNSIVSAGTDIIFCSRNGIHAIRRSMDNGILVYSKPLSDKIDIIYRKLFASVQNPENISAVWDQDERQYHLFFPHASGSLATRLTMTLHPLDETIINWSTGTYLNALCGDCLSGQLVLGTPQGLYDVQDPESEFGAKPTLEFTTPILWHGDLDNTKETHSIIIQASGNGDLQIEAANELGAIIGSFNLKINEDDDGTFPDVPLTRQYEIPFERRYRGVQFKFRSTGKGLLRILGFAVVIRS